MEEAYKMARIQETLKRWKKNNSGTNTAYCPVCTAKDPTLVVHSDEKYITGICMNCAAAARIRRNKQPLGLDQAIS